MLSRLRTLENKLDKEDVKDNWIDKVLEANNKNEVKLIETKFKNMLSNANKGHLEQDLERDNDFIPKM